MALVSYLHRTQKAAASRKLRFRCCQQLLGSLFRWHFSQRHSGHWGREVSSHCLSFPRNYGLVLKSSWLCLMNTGVTPVFTSPCVLGSVAYLTHPDVKVTPQPCFYKTCHGWPSPTWHPQWIPVLKNSARGCSRSSVEKPDLTWERPWAWPSALPRKRSGFSQTCPDLHSQVFEPFEPLSFLKLWAQEFVSNPFSTNQRHLDDSSFPSIDSPEELITTVRL